MNRIVWIALGLIIGIAAIAIAFSGGTEDGIPADCVEFKNDMCALYDCVVELCQCTGFQPILVEGFVAVEDKEDAMVVVEDYVESLPVTEMDDGKMPPIITVTRAVELDNNGLFYNVFADENGDEKVYTVYRDGTVFLTECGV